MPGAGNEGVGFHIEKNGISAGIGTAYSGVDVTRRLGGPIFITGAYSGSGGSQVNVLVRMRNGSRLGLALGPSYRLQNYTILHNGDAGSPRSRFYPFDHQLSMDGLRGLAVFRLGSRDNAVVLRSSLFVGVYRVYAGARCYDRVQRRLGIGNDLDVFQSD